MNKLLLTIQVGVGAGPLRFGMTSQEAANSLGLVPKRSLESRFSDETSDFYWDPFLKLSFEPDRGLTLIETTAECGVSVDFEGQILLNDTGYIENIQNILAARDPSSFIEYQQVVFPALGISIPKDLSDKSASFAIAPITSES